MAKNKYDSAIYQRTPQTVLGFHGCDKSLVDEILNNPIKHFCRVEMSMIGWEMAYTFG